MKIDDIVASLHAEHPGLSAKLDAAQTRRLVRTLFQVLSKGIAEAPEGRVKVQGLGLFKARPSDASAPGSAVDRYVFRPAKANVEAGAE